MVCSCESDTDACAMPSDCLALTWERRGCQTSWVSQLFGINCLTSAQHSIMSLQKMSAWTRCHRHGRSHASMSQLWTAVQDAVNHATDHGALFIASAGNAALNTDITPHYPSSLVDDIVVAVGASTSTDTLWYAPLISGNTDL